MTLVLALFAVVGGCLLWPSGRSRAAPASLEPSGPESDDELSPGGDVGAASAAMRDAATVLTVDEAADALVLCALALRSGLGPIEALEAVADHVGGAVARQLRVVASAHRWGQDAATSWAHVGEAWRPAALAWQAAEQSGAAPAGVVLAAAERMRREEASRVEAAVQRAGVLLVLPLGACFLPGFVGTTVVPVVLHLARSSLGVG
ncbi:hypothetical protein JNB_09759 [Janibacter sp. HTCC2649]|uniref:type II secretion system F family protein n=1 Tax=Janibacter sp. HTCC2649 TaxID=313589 RepID=UPI0000670AC7|nr:type II secretion system F family protein [Janibacter sp. HTCC2649]EAQ00449.1 hypothetical protein JNB_09759 [Janibacter sp. HTCC2649]